MQEFFNVTILAVLQGVAEFLPISSSGHLVIGQHLLGMNPPGMRLEVFLHVGTLASIFAGDFYLGHSHFSQDLDANAKYDEVRIWNGVLTADALTLSAQKGPDATAADLAAVVAKNGEAAPAERTLELNSAATLEIASGTTVTQPVVKGSGTIEGGTLVVSDKIVVNVGEYIEASGTIDLSNAKIELADPENLATAFTFLKTATGQTLTVTGVPTPVNLPKRWKVSVSADGTCRIGKRGFIILVK